MVVLPPTLGEVSKKLAEHGLTLPSMPQSEKITIAGAMANGVHGSSFKEPAVISDHALEMEIITSSGERRKLTPEEMRLARVSLGSLGAVARVKLEAVPNFYLIRRSRRGSTRWGTSRRSRSGSGSSRRRRGRRWR